MADARKRRIVKPAARCTTGAMLLFSAYLWVYFSLWYAMGRGVVSRGAYRMLEETVDAPVECCIDDRYPGSDTMDRLRRWLWFKEAAIPVTWKEIYPAIE
jgi:hypothetical protein